MNAHSLVTGPYAENFFPFSLTRAVGDFRCGILTIREKWQLYLRDHPVSNMEISIPDNCLPDPAMLDLLASGNTDQAIEKSRRLINLPDILSYNAGEIERDFQLITKGRKTAPISSSNHLVGTAIFIEPGAVVENCFLNASLGPVYIGRDALVMEGSMIRGPFAAGEKTVVKMGAKIYGATSAGPQCSLGGEIKNSVFFGYSNKSHDGYLGDSVIGEWCNLGGGSSCSNMKNSGGPVKLWNPITKSFLNAGLKCGVMMGDYSRSAINTSINTGTVIGVSCHVFGNGPTPAYLPSFSWGYDGDIYSLDKAIDHISRWKKFKDHSMSPGEINQLNKIFDQQKQLK